MVNKLTLPSVCHPILVQHQTQAEIVSTFSIECVDHVLLVSTDSMKIRPSAGEVGSTVVTTDMGRGTDIHIQETGLWTWAGCSSGWWSSEFTVERANLRDVRPVKGILSLSSLLTVPELEELGVLWKCWYKITKIIRDHREYIDDYTVMSCWTALHLTTKKSFSWLTMRWPRVSQRNRPNGFRIFRVLPHWFDSGGLSDREDRYRSIVRRPCDERSDPRLMRWDFIASS